MIVRDAAGVPKPMLDTAGKPVPFTVSYPEKDDKGNFLSHPTAGSVVGVHSFGWMFVQATIAILILVGFESVTSMGGEAKNPKRDVPIAVIVSLLVQGCFCYLIEYFAALYLLNSGYTMQTATGSAAPIGDLMIMVGDAIFGPGNGRTFMLIQAFTVVLAIIGTTLSCMNTGARVTYAMGKDDELSAGLGSLHHKTLTPHRAIWTLAVISAVIGCFVVFMIFGDAGALTDATVKALPQGFWSSFGYVSHDVMAASPNSLLTITLASNFGTFLLYMLSCITCIVAYHNHPGLQLPEAHGHPGFRAARKPGLHGVLSYRTLYGIRHKVGALVRSGDRDRVGHLRRYLFHSFQQIQGANHAGQQALRGIAIARHEQPERFARR